MGLNSLQGEREEKMLQELLRALRVELERCGQGEHGDEPCSPLCPLNYEFAREVWSRLQEIESQEGHKEEGE